jgi:hypothetical protein
MFLCLTDYESRHKDVWGGGDITSPSLASALERGEWPVACSGHFTTEERDTSTHWIGGWVGLRASMDTEEEKMSCPCRPARCPSLTDWAILTFLHRVSCPNWYQVYHLFNQKYLQNIQNISLDVHINECGSSSISVAAFTFCFEKC